MYRSRGAALGYCMLTRVHEEGGRRFRAVVAAAVAADPFALRSTTKAGSNSSGGVVISAACTNLRFLSFLSSSSKAADILMHRPKSGSTLTLILVRLRISRAMSTSLLSLSEESLDRGWSYVVGRLPLRAVVVVVVVVGIVVKSS